MMYYNKNKTNFFQKKKERKKISSYSLESFIRENIFSYLFKKLIKLIKDR